jgi:putative RNA 2'-phosphotransferase
MGLTFDRQGFTEISGVLEVLKKNEPFAWAGESDVRAAVQQDAKGRYEISGTRVRARYGHSPGIPVEYPEIEPPPRLFHGATHDALRDIQRTGLQPQGRTFVHLSADEKTAFEVGRRRTPWPVILEVDAQGARRGGARFFRPIESLFLASGIPPQFIRIREPRRAGPPPRFGRSRT